jgi:hypothetical protein
VFDVKLFENDRESLYERAGLKILVSVVRFRDPALLNEVVPKTRLTVFPSIVTEL